MDEQSLITALRDEMITLAENFSPIIEAVEGHREKMVSLGYSNEMSRQMAMHYHGLLMGVITQQMTGGLPK